MEETKEKPKQKQFNALATNITRLQTYTDFFDCTETVLFEWFMVKAGSFGKPFHYSNRRITEETRVKDDRVNKILARFTEMGLISYELKDMPRRKYYTVHREAVIAHLSQIYQLQEEEALHEHHQRLQENSQLPILRELITFYSELLPVNSEQLPVNSEYKGTYKEPIKETLKETEKNEKNSDASASLLFSFSFLDSKYGDLKEDYIKWQISFNTEGRSKKEIEELKAYLQLKSEKEEKEKNSAKKEKPDMAEVLEWYSQLVIDVPGKHLPYKDLSPQSREKMVQFFVDNQDRIRTEMERLKLLRAEERAEKMQEREGDISWLTHNMAKSHVTRVELYNKKHKATKVKGAIKFSPKTVQTLFDMMDMFTASEILSSYIAYVDAILEEEIQPVKPDQYFVHMKDGDYDVVRHYLHVYHTYQ